MSDDFSSILLDRRITKQDISDMALLFGVLGQSVAFSDRLQAATFTLMRDAVSTLSAHAVSHLPTPDWHDDEMCCGFLWGQFASVSMLVNFCPLCGNAVEKPEGWSA